MSIQQIWHKGSSAIKAILVGWILDVLGFLFFPLIKFDFAEMVGGFLGEYLPPLEFSLRFLDLLGFMGLLQGFLGLVKQAGGGLFLGNAFQQMQTLMVVGYFFLWALLLLTLVGYGIFLFALGKWLSKSREDIWPRHWKHMLNLAPLSVGLLHILYFVNLLLGVNEGVSLALGGWLLLLAGLLLVGGTVLHVMESPQFASYRARWQQSWSQRGSYQGQRYGTPSSRKPEMYGPPSPPSQKAPPSASPGWMPPAPPLPESPPVPSAFPEQSEAVFTEEFSVSDVDASDTQLFVETQEVRAWLETAEGQRLPLRLPETSIGRVPKNDIQLSHPSVSKYHARILFKDGRFWLQDLNSTNGTKVGGKRFRGQTVPLQPGVEIQFGTMSPMRFWVR